MEKKIKHLEMIQAIIKRMASNSFMLKGWAVTLVTGIFVLSGKDNDKIYYLVAYIPIIVFWFLDAYYLRQERLYRSLYEKVRALSDSEIDFSLKASPKEFNDEKNKYIRSFISLTEVLFYIPLAIACIIVTWISVSLG